MNEVEWKKNPNWNWWTDVKYHVYYLPKEILRAIVGILQKDHILNEMDWREYIDMAHGIADMKAGRWYRYKEDKK
jgi:hypothetical protein